MSLHLMKRFGWPSICIHPHNESHFFLTSYVEKWNENIFIVSINYDDSFYLHRSLSWIEHQRRIMCDLLNNVVTMESKECIFETLFQIEMCSSFIFYSSFCPRPLIRMKLLDGMGAFQIKSDCIAFRYQIESFADCNFRYWQAINRIELRSSF